MRRKGRECALQILYQLDVGRHLEPADLAVVHAAIGHYWSSFEPVAPEDREFAERLVHGVVGAITDIDSALAGASQNWKLGRMAAVDRSLLRIAAYEILRCPDIPRAATINEAVEIAKRFSSQESAAFVNGVLDQLDAGKA